MKRIPILLLFALCTITAGITPAGAQNKTNKDAPPEADTVAANTMRLAVHNYGDSIVIRWAPSTAPLWILAKKEGFVLRRLALSRNDKNEYKLVDSLRVTIKPWPLEEWAAYFKATHDTLSTLAAQLLYGKTMKFGSGKEGNSMATIFDKYNEQQGRHGFSLLLADFNPQIADGLGLRFVDRAIKKELYYLYTVHPIGDLQGLPRDTARTLIHGAALSERQKIPAITTVPGDLVTHLFWNTPLKGGFSGYVIERSEDGHLFRRLHQLPYVPMTKSSTTTPVVSYVDSLAQNYKKYHYRVSGIDAFGNVSEPSQVVITQGLDLTPPHPPVIMEIKTASGTQKMSFKWTKTDKEPDFKGYVIGRSSNLEGPYEPLHNELLPFSVSEFTDETPSPIAPNYYVVTAVDTAGNTARSLPAYRAVVDNIPPAQPGGFRGSIDSTGVVSLHWDWNAEADLAGYTVYAANATGHEFTPVNKEMVRDSLFTDSIPLKTLTKKIHYQLIAYDRSMNPSKPAVLELEKPDIVSPVAAIIHSFHVTDSGVAIRWRRSPSDDVAKQLVYRKEKEAGNWQLIKELPAADTAYADKTVESGHVYTYAVETLDAGRLSSGRSFPLQVHVHHKGNTGSIRNFKVSRVGDKTRILLEWSPPGENIHYYILFKGENQEGLKMAGNIAGNKQQHEDHATTGSLQYALKAVYKDGKESALSAIETITLK